MGPVTRNGSCSRRTVHYLADICWQISERRRAEDLFGAAVAVSQHAVVGEQIGGSRTSGRMSGSREACWLPAGAWGSRLYGNAGSGSVLGGEAQPCRGECVAELADRLGSHAVQPAEVLLADLGELIQGGVLGGGECPLRWLGQASRLRGCLPPGEPGWAAGPAEAPAPAGGVARRAGAQ